MSTTESPAQAQLFGQPAARETHRLFFALMPDAATRHDINHAAATVQQQHPKLRARWVKPERFHATLNFLGDYAAVPDEVMEKAMAAADTLHAAPFAWALDYAASFRGREPPCVLRGTHVPELLLALWRDLHASLVQAGLKLRAERQYTPHVTLAYARHELPEVTPVTPIVWQVDRFVLIHNVVGKGSYQILGSWKLAGIP
ncbi:RNA 2',3'-cyclic phosphodiesterase [Dyella acidisoli]|uniref:RNA 2',3'-cyclic phosphodiesterase n=1 Tax=Dyella acidisoli TaxID=1867834 RepID=A0ABQ5XV56_9GAMM|nr:RNA 2',3'-cyclic phosphodiesterase [Dyella acidisoli]GLQ94290.1 RNA 2',3'-cyclic phosphodiesterase [Dyella acidisoli]